MLYCIFERYTIQYLYIAKRVNLKSSHHKEEKSLYLYKVMDVNLVWQTFRNMYVYQVMLYTLNLYNVICQLYCNNTGKQ